MAKTLQIKFKCKIQKIMKKSILSLGKVITKREQLTIKGSGESRFEYCKTLRGLIFGGGYQGDRDYAMETYNKHCGSGR